MTERTFKRGQRVLVWVTLKAETNQREPTGLWWVQLDGQIGLTCVHQDAMVVAHGERGKTE